jgi:isoamylase
VIYEAHLRGMTMQHPAIGKDKAGTFDAMGEAAIIEQIKSLGVTAVELLPIHAFVNDHHLQAKDLNNYWGYNTIGFFAPHAPYAGPRGIDAVRDMVRRYHDAGLEVILDVVYNHTAEGNERGATLSFKGIDNVSYYRLMPDRPRYYINDTGTGNTVNASHPFVLRMILDSLRYWAEMAEVDGFRFDLGSILGREADGFDQSGSFLDAVGQDPILRKVKLIGEPWDIGPGGYQVGGFPPGWAEWNDKYRDTLRDFWRGEGGVLPGFAARIAGSGDLYDRRGRRPWASVNFLTAHDGFTLNDLVSYNEKHNAANGEDNKDGHSDNRAFNHGVEGPTGDPSIVALRERQKRNLLASLLLSHGTPMLLAGDEIGNTQDGNNNVYAQDNALSWIDWGSVDENGEHLRAFVARLAALRAGNAIFRRASFRDGCVLRWLSPSGEELDEGQWQDDAARSIGLMMERPEDGGEGVRTALMLFNAHDDAVSFTLPPHPDDRPWTLCLSTEDPTIEDLPLPAEPAPYLVGPRALALLI